MKNIKLLVLAFLMGILLSFSSCRKDKESLIKDEYVTELQDDAQVNDLLDDVDAEAEDVSIGASDLKSATEDSLNYPGRTAVWTKTDTSKIGLITYVNFQHPRSKNERLKNGKIHIVITGHRDYGDYKRVITFENFTINGNKIEGTRTIERVNVPEFEITLKNGKITFTDSTFITCESIRTRRQMAGIMTGHYLWDDVYSFNGTASGLNRKRVQYTKTTEDVIIQTNFRFPIKGTVELKVGDKEFTLDYGNGSLDNIATITYNGETKEINLRK